MSGRTRRRWNPFRRGQAANDAEPLQTNTPSKESFLGLKVETEGQNPVVDIVIVHGLNGQREKTWTASNGTHWPRDLLSSDIPNARILNWGYDASTHGGQMSCMYLYDHAKQLVSDLCLERKLTETMKRPIIFVAHSLGGIVVKSALIHADSARDGALKEHRSIKISTYGIVFMGTPHQGVSSVQLGKLMVHVASVFVPADTRLLRQLERESEWLQLQLDQYRSISGDFVTKFAFEVYQTRTVMGHSLLVVPQTSAVVPGAVDAESIAIYADHINMVKFASKEDSGYKTIAGHIRLMAQVANDKVSEQWKTERRLDAARRNLDLSASQPVWTVPFNRNNHFVGREGLLTWLRDKIPPGRAKDRCQLTAIQGLGGIGKTQLALEAVFRVRDEDSTCSVFWVPMMSMVTFENAYRDIGRRLHVPGIDDDQVDVKRLVKSALDSEQCGSWLLVMDNADDTEFFFGSELLHEWLPSAYHGSIVITTRNGDVCRRLGVPQDDIRIVDKMKDQEAIQLLTDHLETGCSYHRDDMMAICQLLAHLPLALQQAGAYMAMTGITASKYLRYCRESDDRMIRLLGYETDVREGRYNQGISNAVATTWLISFTHLVRDHWLAADLLKTAAWIGEKDIPRSMLWREGLDEMDLDEAIGALRNYAFINLHEDQTSFDVHSLVQLMTRSWIRQESENGEGIWVGKVIELLEKVYPLPEHENREVWQRYLPHAERVVGYTASAVKDVHYERLVFDMALSSSFLGKYTEAEKLSRETLALREKRLGADHPSTLNSINNLAIVLEQQGNYSIAEKMHRETLDLRKERLGTDHLSTLDSMNNLGLILNLQGKYLEGEKIQQETVDLKRELLGVDDPSTLGSMTNLAGVLQRQDKYLEAEKIQQEALDLARERLGPDHPSTLGGMTNLAIIFEQQGKYLEAEKLHQETLQRLSVDHPSTPGSMSNLAIILEKQGRYSEAEKMQQEALDLMRERLGVDHPSTLGSMNNLALVFQQQGKYLEAEGLQRETLSLKRKRLGVDHPSTLGSLKNLAEVLRRQGKNLEAEEEEKRYQETLQLREAHGNVPS